MKRELLLFLILFAASPVYADPTPPSPVTLPAGPPVPPQPAPPKTPTKLAADQVYVVRASVQCSVIDGTEGIVKITEMQGPVTIRAKFTDSVGYETRTLTDKYIYLVEPVGTGRTDLIITYPPSGKIRVCLDVNGAPTPPKPPDPPQPPVDSLTKAFQAAYDADADLAKASNVRALAALYRTAASSTVTDPANKTYADLFRVMQSASAKLIPATAIQSVRKAVGDYLTPALGTGTADGTAKAIDRATTAAEFLKVATALEVIK